MNFKLSTLAAAAALLVNCSAPVMAGDYVPLRTIGHWQLRASDHVCDASGVFRDGTRLEFAINTKGALIISVVNPKWSIPKGVYDVVMQVDRAEAKTFAAEAHNAAVDWVIPLTEESLNLLSFGRTLYAKVGTQSFQYDLALSEPVIKALSACIGQRMASANPFAAQQSAAPPAAAPPANPFAETTSNPYRRM
jgi:hypothetical protein